MLETWQKGAMNRKPESRDPFGHLDKSIQKDALARSIEQMWKFIHYRRHDSIRSIL